MITVLIADDHALVREGLSLLLSGAEDVTVVGLAADGQQAVNLVASHRPDVVLMDLSMPVMDGVEATRAITDEHPDGAVVVLTTFSDNRRVMDSLEAGAVGYLMKDSTPADILAGVRAAAQGGSPLDPRVARSIIDAQRRAAALTPAAPAEPPATPAVSPAARAEAPVARAEAPVARAVAPVARAVAPVARAEAPVARAESRAQASSSDARTDVRAVRAEPLAARADSRALTAKQTEVLRLVARGLSNRLIARTLGISEKTVKTHLTTIYAVLGVTDRVQAALWAQRHLEQAE